MESSMIYKQKLISTIGDELKKYIFEKLFCTKCDQIAVDIRYCADCEAPYCQLCVQKLNNQSDGCQNSQCNAKEIKNRSQNAALTILKAFYLDFCPFSVNGCDETNVKYDHLKECHYQKNKASETSCELCKKTIFYKDRDKHYKNDCEGNMIPCGICKQKYNKHRLEEHRQTAFCLNKSRIKDEKKLLSAVQRNVIFVGDSGVGKTTLIATYEKGLYEPDKIVATFPVDSTILKVRIDNEDTRICFWSISGKRDYQSLNRDNYYRNKDIAFVIYDIGDKNSFLNVTYWLKEIKNYVRTKDKKAPRVILVGNKKDLQATSQISNEEISDLIFQCKINDHFQVSAKDNPKEVQEIFTKILNSQFVKKQIIIEEEHEEEKKVVQDNENYVQRSVLRYSKVNKSIASFNVNEQKSQAKTPCCCPCLVTSDKSKNKDKKSKAKGQLEPHQEERKNSHAGANDDGFGVSTDATRLYLGTHGGQGTNETPLDSEPLDSLREAFQQQTIILQRNITQDDTRAYTPPYI